MKNRIKQLIEKENVSSAQFAEYIGISPSSLHHIVSGRNNPGLEVIQKILNRFKYLNALWLITGEGEAYKKMEQASLFEEDDIPTIVSSGKKHPKQEDRKGKEEQLNTISKQDKPVEKIVVFYADKTFEVFKPSEI